MFSWESEKRIKKKEKERKKEIYGEIFFIILKSLKIYILSYKKNHRNSNI